jgi:AcrR family transcriptional regulator
MVMVNLPIGVKFGLNMPILEWRRMACQGQNTYFWIVTTYFGIVTTSWRNSQLTAKGRETRERIVRHAAALMYERGVANTSIEEVREAAGISNSQLYHYFADKTDLTHAVIDYQVEQVLAVQRALLESPTSLGSLRSWCDAVVDLADDRHGQGGCPLGALASELADTDDYAREALAAAFARWEQTISSALDQLRQRGILGEDAQPTQLAQAVLSALQGGLLLSQTRRDSLLLASALEATIDHIASYATQPNIHGSPSAGDLR